MGIFDKISKIITAGANKNSLNDSNDESSYIIDAIEQRNKNIQLENCIKVSFSDFSSLGANFAKLIPSLRSQVSNGQSYVPVNMANGDILKTAGKGLFYGAHVTPSGKSVMTKWAKAAPVVASEINPAMIIMVAMLADIEKKMDTIQKTQFQILLFLEQDKQADQQGNINVLTDILNSYKYNWDNAQYLSNHHMKVLDIKQSSEQNILFYQRQIASEIKKFKVILSDKNSESALMDIVNKFSNYRTSLYIFSLSSLLEVLLLGNFCDEYLNQVAEKVIQYDNKYQNEFLSCHDDIKKAFDNSFGSKAIETIANASKSIGKFVASVPIPANSSVDKWLTDSGEKLIQGSNNKINQILSMFSIDEKFKSDVFSNIIKNIAIISNQTTGIVFDKDGIYLAKS